MAASAAARRCIGLECRAPGQITVRGLDRFRFQPGACSGNGSRGRTLLIRKDGSTELRRIKVLCARRPALMDRPRAGASAIPSSASPRFKAMCAFCSSTEIAERLASPRGRGGRSGRERCGPAIAAKPRASRMARRAGATRKLASRPASPSPRRSSRRRWGAPIACRLARRSRADAGVIAQAIPRGQSEMRPQFGASDGAGTRPAQAKSSKGATNMPKAEPRLPSADLIMRPHRMLAHDSPRPRA